jgi:hypothetical protein
MQTQNYSNHARLHKPFHFLFIPLGLAGLIGSIINLTKANEVTCYSASLLVLAFVLILFFALVARKYALVAQDRAIRAEENFRHFILTGKPLDSQLRIGQIIALRFASDAEFPSLAEKAVKENLSQKEIKTAIKNWREDFNRV